MRACRFHSTAKGVPNTDFSKNNFCTARKMHILRELTAARVFRKVVAEALAESGPRCGNFAYPFWCSSFVMSGRTIFPLRGAWPGEAVSVTLWASFTGKETMAMQTFVPGDDLVFQLESGYGLLRVLAVEEHAEHGQVWHLLAYEDMFPDVELAEAMLASGAEMRANVPHLALTARAFERTPAARLGHRPVRDEELAAYHRWRDAGGPVSDRSALLMLGLR
jgi:hypothetical protein